MGLVRDELITVQAIFAPLASLHTDTPFKFISKLFCDGIVLTDTVFDNHNDFESFFAERDVHIYVT